MKRVLVLTIGMVLLSLAVGTVQAAEIYWTPGQEADEAAVESETAVRSPQARVTVTPAPVQIYDSGDDVTAVVEMSEEETREPAVRRPRQEAPSVVRPRTSDSERAQTRKRRSSDTTTSAETEQKATVQKPKKKRGTPTPSSTGELEKPESQRAKPDELDVQPAEPKSKLQWGR